MQLAARVAALVLMISNEAETRKSATTEYECAECNLN